MGKKAALLLIFGALICCSHKSADNRSITILLSGDILSLDPNSEFEAITDSVLFNVFQPLVELDKDLNLRPVLAESWENPKPDEWRFYIRPDVRFHDGTPLTAEVVRDALLHVRDTHSLDTSSFLSFLREVRAKDNTITVITDHPYALLTRISFVYITKPNANGNYPPLVGTGPYRMVSWQPGRSVILQRSDRYWGDRPAISDATFIPISDSGERLQRLIKGTGDIAYSLSPELVRSGPEVKFTRHPGLTVYYLGFGRLNDPENPFAKAAVRKAIHLAVDRNSIVQNVLNGYGSIPTQAVSSFVFGYDPGLPLPSSDLRRAKALMQEAGYPQGFKVQLDLAASRLPAGRILQRDLARIGIQVELKPVAVDEVYELAENGKSDFFLAGWDCTSGDASEFYEFCMHTSDGTYGKGNYGRYSNSGLDRLIEASARMTDQNNRKEMLQQASRIVMEDLPIVPLYIADDIYAMRRSIRFEPRADSEIKLSDIRFQ